MEYLRAALNFFLAWLILPTILATTTMAAGPTEGIQYDKKTGTLTVHVQDMPLNEVLQMVSAASGLKLSVQADLNRPVTMDFTAVPLDKAIHRLVQPNSSAMIYSKKEDGAVVLSSVKIFDKGGTPSSPSENLPMPRVTGRRNNQSNNDSTKGGGGGGPADQGGSGRNNRRNRGQQGGAASDSSAQASGTAGTTGSQGTTAGGSSGGGEHSGR